MPPYKLKSLFQYAPCCLSAESTEKTRGDWPVNTPAEYTAFSLEFEKF